MKNAASTAGSFWPSASAAMVIIRLVVRVRSNRRKDEDGVWLKSDAVAQLPSLTALRATTYATPASLPFGRTKQRKTW